MANFNGMMDLNIKDNSKIICLMELESIFGLIKNNIQANGKTTQLMEKE